jgi:uncharacterized protein (TIRG00374 family)
VEQTEHRHDPDGGPQALMRARSDRRRRTTHPRAVVTAIGLVVTLLLCWVAVRDVRLGEMLDGLRRCDPTWLVPALAVFAVSILLRAVRWRMLFEPAHRPPIGAATRALLIGYFFNNLLPARAGDAARIIRINDEAGVPRAEALTTVVVERIFDVLSLLIMFFVALPWLPPVDWVRQAAVLAAALAVGLVVVILGLAIFDERPIRLLLRPMRFLPSERLEFAARHVLQGLRAMRSISVALVAFVVTTASWLVMAASFWLLMHGFDMANAGAALLVLITVNLTMIVPSGPAALGVFEAGTVVALRAYEVPRSGALSVALVLHALNFFPFILAGGLLLLGRAIPPHLRTPIERSAAS